MRKTKIIILFCIVLIVGGVITSIWIKLREEKSSMEAQNIPSKASTEKADASLEKVRFVEDKHGRKTWELEAKAIHQFQDQNVVALEDVKVTFYPKEGGTFILSGNRGKIYQDSKDMELQGDVVLTSSERYRLKTQSISYRHSEKRATTSDPVEIEGEQIHLVGKGMVVDMEGKTFKILNRVKTQWKTSYK